MTNSFKTITIVSSVIFIVLAIIIVVIVLINKFKNPKSIAESENQDCELSYWSEVGDCTITSDISENFLGQIRLQRNVIKPQKGNGRPCGELTMMYPCNLKNVCRINYGPDSETVTDWSPSDERCIEGEIQKRIVTFSKPNITNRESGCTGTYQISRICTKQPVNCVVSDYGPCIDGIETRFVLFEDRNGGQKCPQLSRPCSNSY